MTTLQAATTSTGTVVTDAQAVHQLCKAHCFRTLNWEVDEEGELIIWGYGAFEVYEAREDGLPDYEGGLVTHEFLRPLAGYLEPNEELDIQTAGFTKCRSQSPQSGTSSATAKSSMRISVLSVRSTCSRINGDQSWMYAAIDLDTNLILDVALFGRRGTDPAAAFLHGPTEKHDLFDGVFLVDGTGYLTVLSRLGLSGHLD